MIFFFVVAAHEKRVYGAKSIQTPNVDRQWREKGVYVYHAFCRPRILPPRSRAGHATGQRQHDRLKAGAQCTRFLPKRQFPGYPPTCSKTTATPLEASMAKLGPGDFKASGTRAATQRTPRTRPPHPPGIQKILRRFLKSWPRRENQFCFIAYGSHLRSRIALYVKDSGTSTPPPQQVRRSP